MKGLNPESFSEVVAVAKKIEAAKEAGNLKCYTIIAQIAQSCTTGCGKNLAVDTCTVFGSNRYIH